MQESLQEGKTRVFLRELKHFDFKVFYMQERGVQTEVQMPSIAWKNLANLFDDHFRIQSIWKTDSHGIEPPKRKLLTITCSCSGLKSPRGPDEDKS